MNAVPRDLHRRAIWLFFAVITLLVIVELLEPRADTVWSAWGSFAVYAVWCFQALRSKRPNAVPIFIGSLVYLCVFSVVESAAGLQINPFDHTATYGAVLILSTLVGAMVERHRMRWALGLSIGVGVWITVIGLVSGLSTGAMFTRWIIGVAGVLVAVWMVERLTYNLREAARIHERARRLNDAIAACSESLLVHSDRFAIHEAARALIQATDADYVFIARSATVDGEPGWEIVAEASRSGAGLDPGLRRGRNADIPTTTKALHAGKPVIIRPNELPPEEAAQYEGDGMITEVVVPIYVGRELRGSIGFIQYTDDRDWTDDEVKTLQRASDMIAAYWERLDTAEQLRASNESKDRLLSSVSHEIRTPLTAIVGLSEAIVDGSGLAEDEVAELMSIIARQSRELSELVEDLLVASRADFGNLSIRPEPVDLIGQVRRVVEGLRQGSCKNIQVIGDEVWAWADPLRVRQIIRNLVSNAIKYGGENITVTFQVDPSTVQLVVADDGPGVRAEEAELIFQRYYRSSDSPTLPGSVGIGLAVSRQLAELMSGTLRYVPSEGFVLTLPSLAAGERAATLLA